MADIEEAVLSKVSADLQATTNSKVIPVVTDVAREAELQNVLKEALDNFDAVHLLFNNAGVGGGGNAWTATQNDWDWVLGVNLWSVINGLRIFVPQMISQNEPCHIVNTASVAGLLGGTTNALYSVTKHGVVALTENLFGDLHNENTQIGCSVLCPGFVNTNIFDSGRNRPEGLMDNAEPVVISAEDEERMAMFRQILRDGMQPAEIAEAVFDGIRNDRLYILSHDHFDDLIKQRADNITQGQNPNFSEMGII